MGTNETGKYVGSKSSHLTIQFLCISIPETLLLLADIFVRLLQYLHLQEFDNNYILLGTFF